MSGLKPFFCYYGGKWRAALHYPAPTHDTVIEPFAGAAGYATRHHARKVVLYDASPVIAGLWQYLIRTSAEEILRLPERIEHVDEVQGPQEARRLVGFWLNKGTASPRQSPSRWMRDGKHTSSFWGAEVRARIARQVEHIRHWRVCLGTYEMAEDVEATWFIDPPYDNAAGRQYTHRFTDYAGLADFCRTRRGQVLVCENDGATWLPFKPFRTIKSMEGSHGKGRSVEVLWTNDQQHAA